MVFDSSSKGRFSYVGSLVAMVAGRRIGHISKICQNRRYFLSTQGMEARVIRSRGLPTSSSGREERSTLRHDLELILELAPATQLVTIMGDFNAEMGNNQNRAISGWDSVGSFSSRLPKSQFQDKNGGIGAHVMAIAM